MAMNEQQAMEAVTGWLASLRVPATGLVTALMCAQVSLEMGNLEMANRMLDRALDSMNALIGAPKLDIAELRVAFGGAA